MNIFEKLFKKVEQEQIEKPKEVEEKEGAESLEKFLKERLKKGELTEEGLEKSKEAMRTAEKRRPPLG